MLILYNCFILIYEIKSITNALLKYNLIDDFFLHPFDFHRDALITVSQNINPSLNI